MNLYRILSRKRTLQAGLALLLITSSGLGLAQTQKRKPHKLRATGLLELTTDRAGKGKAQLTPICILTDGRFEDASIYKAAPQPMAIDNGIVYEAQKTGVPVGYVTITNSTKAGIWTALGKWQVVTTVAKKTEPTAAPPNPGDGRPRLKRAGDSSSSSSSQQPPSPTPDAGSSGDDRPRLHRPNDSSGSSSPSASPSASPTPDSSSESSGGSDDDRPRLHRPNERPAEDTASPTPTPASAPSLNQDASQNTPAPSQEPPPEDSDRPVLRRRSPSTAAAAPTPAATSGPSAKATPVPQGTVTSTVPKAPAAGTQDLVAVSDNQP
jgi:hypothetical protein